MFSHTIKIGTGSSSHHPKHKGGMTTCDIVTLVCYDGVWFRPLIRSQLKIWDDLKTIKDSHELEAYMERIRE
ncbi:MAG: hypothetical protein QM660_10915 [Dysgonomonas sp.]